MVSTVLANVLESYLGQYLELSDTKISVGSEIKLKNVSTHVVSSFHLSKFVVGRGQPTANPLPFAGQTPRIGPCRSRPTGEMRARKGVTSGHQGEP